MEKEYQKAIHHISTLILNSQYVRAHNILNFLVKQGIYNIEITVMQSYCIKMTKGIDSAINFLENCHNQSPLIRMALAQYYKELHENGKCLRNLQKIQKASQNQLQKSSLVSSMARSVQISVQYDKKPPVYEKKYGEFDITAINMINNIVQNYKTEQINAQKTKKQFQNILRERNLQGKLKEYVKKYIKYLQYENKEYI